jgi:hypothetical protein
MDLGFGPARTCQFIGAEQKAWPYTFCGKKSIGGKSYCEDHYWEIYKKGSATAGRRAEKEVDKEIAELKLQQEINEMENDNA